MILLQTCPLLMPGKNVVEQQLLTPKVYAYFQMNLRGAVLMSYERSRNIPRSWRCSQKAEKGTFSSFLKHWSAPASLKAMQMLPDIGISGDKGRE